MNRLAILLGFGALFLMSASGVDASLINIAQDGAVTVNVLASEDSPDVSQIGGEQSSFSLNNIDLSIQKRDENTYLYLDNGEQTKTLDITNYNDDLVEVEGRQGIQKLTISKIDDNYQIQQDGLIVVTDYQIDVNAKDGDLLIVTPTGKKYLLVFPTEAALTLLRSKVVNKISKDQKIQMSENDGVLTYAIFGKKVFSVFGFLGFEIDVQTKVSATTGEVVAITSPEWMKILSAVFI